MNRKIFHALISSAFLFFNFAQAQVEINVSGAKTATKKVAVVPFANDNAKIDFIVSVDLKKSGMFQPIDPRLFAQKPSIPQEVNPSAFKNVGAEYIVIGRSIGNSVNFALHDLNKIIVADNIQGTTPQQIGHQIADRVLQVLTGKRGAFGTQLAFVAERGNGSERSYSLVVSDTDGTNRREIFRSNNPILSPAWAPNSRALAFATYANNHAQIVIQEIGGNRRIVAQTENTSSSPAFSPDGRFLAFVQSENGNSNIFLTDLANNSTKRLTNHNSINTEPQFSPDGRTIFFTSDRNGSPQIYRMNINGDNASRIATGNAYSANSNLSPDGKTIAITRQSNNGSQIGLFDIQSGNFQALTNGRLDEGASFAPNGQMIIYATRENGRSILKIVNHKGGLVQIIADNNARLHDPAWSPDNRK